MAPGIVITLFVAIVGLAALVDGHPLRDPSHRARPRGPASAVGDHDLRRPYRLSSRDHERPRHGDRKLEQAADEPPPPRLAHVPGRPRRGRCASILAFALLAVAWLLAAVGLRPRRRDPRRVPRVEGDGRVRGLDFALDFALPRAPWCGFPLGPGAATDRV